MDKRKYLEITNNKCLSEKLYAIFNQNEVQTYLQNISNMKLDSYGTILLSEDFR
tara:strand:- start:3320 stop:3481 length:162 start_codon:yes stop_codon:yes gene_type:complete